MVLACRRGGKIAVAPGAAHALNGGDVLVVLGETGALARLRERAEG